MSEDIFKDLDDIERRVDDLYKKVIVFRSDVRPRCFMFSDGTCSECGNVIDKSNAFCPFCGSKVIKIGGYDGD